MATASSSRSHRTSNTLPSSCGSRVSVRTTPMSSLVGSNGGSWPGKTTHRWKPSDSGRAAEKKSSSTCPSSICGERRRPKILLQWSKGFESISSCALQQSWVSGCVHNAPGVTTTGWGARTNLVATCDQWVECSVGRVQWGVVWNAKASAPRACIFRDTLCALTCTTLWKTLRGRSKLVPSAWKM